jgi:hypothetical protein
MEEMKKGFCLSKKKFSHIFSKHGIRKKAKLKRKNVEIQKRWKKERC